MMNERYDELREQLFHPDHCYVELRPGKPIRHSRAVAETPEGMALSGQPVRFTRLAAVRVVEQLRKDGVRAKMVEI